MWNKLIPIIIQLRVRELATAVEIKENESLRLLKDQNIKPKSSSHEHQMKKSSSQAGLDESSEPSGMPGMPFCIGKEELPKPMSGKSTMNDKLPKFTHDRNEQVRGPSLTNENEDIQGSSYKNSNDDVVVEECHDPRPVSCLPALGTVKSDNKDGESCSWSMRSGRKRDRANELPSNVDDDVICFGNTNPVETSQHIGKETSSSIPVSQPGKSESI